MHLAELDELLGERARLEQLRVLGPGHDRRGVVPQPEAQAPALADGQHGDLPAAATALGFRDADVEHGARARGLAVQLGRHDLPGPAAELAQVDSAAPQVHAVEGDLGDPPEVDEDLTPLQGDDQPEDPGRLAARGRQDDDVPNPADRLALAVQQLATAQPRGEYRPGGHGRTPRHPNVISGTAS